MRFFHIADVHLGAEPDKGFPWSQDRSREIWDSFRRVIEQAGQDHADLFLICRRSVPPAAPGKRTKRNKRHVFRHSRYQDPSDCRKSWTI